MRALGLEEDEVSSSEDDDEGGQEGHDAKGPDDFVDQEVGVSVCTLTHASQHPHPPTHHTPAQAHNYERTYGRRLSVFQV